MKQQKKYLRRIIYLTPDEDTKLRSLAAKSGKSQSAVLRSLVDEAVIREMPPADYHSMTAELHAIGNNLNQLARVANATGKIEKEAYRQNADALYETLSKIQLAIYKR